MDDFVGPLDGRVLRQQQVENGPFGHAVQALGQRILARQVVAQNDHIGIGQIAVLLHERHKFGHMQRGAADHA
ncbi:hypothetical protein LP420_39575 [Massilia sp. B-10]|nr:hypothetical protein LP420_39575 [Massilia sp. B-10]